MRHAPPDFLPKTPCACDNCDWKGDIEDLREPPALHLWERLEPGSTVPAGECPDCGAFAYLECPPVSIRETLIRIESELSAAFMASGVPGDLLAHIAPVAALQLALEKETK